MPAAIEYITDASSPELRELEEAFTHEYDARAKRIALHRAYYDGEMHRPLKVEGDGVDDNVILAKVDQIADKSVSFLYGDGVQFDDGDDEEESEVDKAIEALWLANRRDVLLHNMAMDGSLCGHVFVRLEPRESEPCRIVNVDPALCSVFWDALDSEKVLWYRLQYAAGRYGKRVDYVKGRQLNAGWDHTPDVWQEVVYSRQPFGAMWTLESITQKWEYDFAPIVAWQNMPRPHIPYGADDVHKAIALNDAINLIASDWNRILKHHSMPKTIGIGMDAADVVPSEVGGFYTVKTSKVEAEIYNLEMQSDLAAAQELLGILTREAWQSARLVDPQTVKDQVGKLTNFGLHVLFADALRKTATKRLLYGEGLEEVTRRGLVLSGYSAPAEITVTWPDVLPEDNEAIATALLAELAAGIMDKQTYRELRGYDHEKIEERLKEERASEDNLGTRLLAAFEGGGRQGRGVA